ncbi:hypothetical protein Dthio_PD3336 [Desulfonatronospira thiodismutans ASO3-1]|uniref:Uncharacterized protein n=1 Tax=Desulfonatronospira thiodismutans ASO3-1 TaxID=555779 RepID=D6SMH9_9BACT|nr:hypothetical protein Dthio_PD3329 [Desulfonatronospira thiodismutans ASO3-1]EFI35897.1 hypothetical protein Dthio_PD3336 [Desulfonatronospira thiodismutans ASO3-1]
MDKEKNHFVLAGSQAKRLSLQHSLFSGSHESQKKVSAGWLMQSAASGR